MPDSEKMNPSDETLPVPPGSIGSAEMDQDGTITLYLRAGAPDGTIGEAKLIYRPADKNYTYVLQHLGNIKPGQSCTVKPFPDV